MRIFLFLLFAFSGSPVFSQTPADQITVAPGFKVELLKSASSREGSWVSMTIDDRGRLYISPQNKAPDGGIMRVTLDERGQVAKTDWVKSEVGAAMGMVWAFNSLYVSGQGPDGQAIYRLRDTNGDGNLDTTTLFKKVPGGGGEHGAHGIALGPDGKSLFFSHGNGTPLVEGIAPDSPYRNWEEDDLLPRVMDPDDSKVPQGHILRTDENGTRWELYAGGIRNQYDIDFNADGELFTYDSDMEWDVGLPWYRPTRILHLVPGGEYGFREASAKWPDYYPDSLPPVVDIGLGSPTGVKFGTRSNFPEKYRRALFVMDWTFGRILAVHMQPKGASYTAQAPALGGTGPIPHPTGPTAGGDVELFLWGKGMPVADLEVGKDGAMYFITGGRGTQSALYRVSFASTANPRAIAEGPRDRIVPSSEGTRRVRRSMESELFRDESLPAQSVSLRALAVSDRYIRNAARLALESMPLESVKTAVSLQNPRASLTALLALARVGAKADQEPLIEALARWPFDSLDEELKLLKLRVIKLNFARHGRPALQKDAGRMPASAGRTPAIPGKTDAVAAVVEELLRQYPAASYPLNRELSELLVWLTNPEFAASNVRPGGRSGATGNAALSQSALPGGAEVVAKTFSLLANAPSQEEQIWYAAMLRCAAGLTPKQREEYFRWFKKAREFKGGNSLAKFIVQIRDEALTRVPEADRAHCRALSELELAKPAPAPVRPVVRNWTMADLAADLDQVGQGRDFDRGRKMYAAAQCAACHLFAGEGGNIGPELTAAASRYNRRDLLEAIIDPNKGISEQYAVYHVTQFDGKKEVAGMIIDENNDHFKVLVDPLRGGTEMISKYRPPKRELLPVSPMPPGLLNTLTKEEILDLLAFIESGGNAGAAAFAK